MPLRCVPDVLLENTRTGAILIIERKFTSVPETKVPAMGWANLKAQLWCYGWIDDWRGASNVFHIGQFWRMPYISKLPRMSFPMYNVRGELLYEHLRTDFKMMDLCPRWQRNDARFDQECAELFTQYGGTIS